MPPMLSARAAAVLANAGGGPILIAGSAAAPVAVLGAAAAEPDLWQGATLTGAFIPGINERDLTACGRDITVETIFTTRALGSAAGRVRHLPLHYSAFWRRLARPGGVGAVITTVPLPRADGTIGLGLAADFAPAAIAAGAALIGVVNPAMPDVADGPRYAAGRFAALVEDDSPLTPHDPGPVDAATRAIAAHVLGLLRPGDTLQLGLGSVQGAVLQALAASGLRGLRFHAGMVTPPILDALQAGAVTGPVTTGVAVAPAGFDQSRWQRADLRFRPVGETHDAARLAAIPAFVSVNTALEVDLLGQANAEWIGGRQVSGQGGLVDFLRGARASVGGRAILALPSVTRDGSVSRIVPALAPGTPVTVARADTHLVVTEHGIADLSGAALDERAERLVAIADPRHRDRLAQAWDRMRKGAA